MLHAVRQNHFFSIQKLQHLYTFLMKLVHDCDRETRKGAFSSTATRYSILAPELGLIRLSARGSISILYPHLFGIISN